MRKLVLFAVVAVFSFAAAGCGEEEAAAPEPVGTEPATTAAADECAKENLELVAEGRLTIGTDNPAFPPWFEGGTPDGSQWELNDPSTGEGFESAVAYAVADRLGFAEEEVDWVVVPFDQSFRPGPKDFDWDINQVSYLPERDNAVDFSDSYYDVNQALVAIEGTPIAEATTLEELKGYRLGAQIGTTSFNYIEQNIQPDQEPSVYNTNADVISALRAKQIDGIVVDLPTAFFVVAVEIENGTIVGQFPTVGTQERFGMVFEEGNSLVDCVNGALAELKEDGTLAGIQQEWLSDKASAPVLE